MVIDNGWIKLHRKFLKWEWYSDANTKSVFLHLLLNANYEKRNWMGRVIEVGEVVTSVKALSKSLNLTTQQTRTSLERLKSTNEITIKTTNKYSVIKLCKFSIYQELDDEEQQAKQQAEQQTSNKQITNKQQTNNKQITTPKEIKEIKEVKEIEEFKEKDISSKTEDSKPKPEKKAYGELDNVFLTDDEFSKLEARYGTEKTMKSIEYLSLYKPDKNYKNKSDYASIIRWVANAIDEQNERKNKYSPNKKQENDDFFSGIADWVSKNQEGGFEDGCEPIW